MCYFIVIAVPANRAPAFAESVPRGLVLAPCNRLSKRLSGGFREFCLISGMCSCGLFRERGQNIKPSKERREEKYRKLGWSDAKIKRALRDHEPEYPKAPHQGLREDVRKLLASEVERGSMIAVFVFFDHREHETERKIAQAEERSVTANELQLEDDCIKEGMIYWVVPNKRIR